MATDHEIIGKKLFKKNQYIDMMKTAAASSSQQQPAPGAVGSDESHSWRRCTHLSCLLLLLYFRGRFSLALIAHFHGQLEDTPHFYQIQVLMFDDPRLQ